jgi:hypothetical protein
VVFVYRRRRSHFARRGVVKVLRDFGVEGGLVGLQRQEVVAAGVDEGRSDLGVGGDSVNRKRSFPCA